MSPQSETLRVLLIEDSAGDAQLFEEWLQPDESSGFEVVWKETLVSGIERCMQGDLDCILLDLNLPDSQGLNTFLTAYESAPGVPIVVLTGHRDEELAIGTLRRGAQDYLLKDSLDAAVLIRSIRYAIERYQRPKDARPVVADALPSSPEAAIPAVADQQAQDEEPETRDPFAEMVEEYAQHIRAYASKEETPSGSGADSAAVLIAMAFSERDVACNEVIRIHVAAIEQARQGIGRSQFRAVNQKAGSLLLGVVTTLGDLYRERCLGEDEQDSGSLMDNLRI